jgi:hypothetical protein
MDKKNINNNGLQELNEKAKKKREKDLMMLIYLQGKIDGVKELIEKKNYTELLQGLEREKMKFVVRGLYE